MRSEASADGSWLSLCCQRLVFQRMLPPPSASRFILSSELQKARDDSALGVLSCPKPDSPGELGGKDGLNVFLREYLWLVHWGSLETRGAGAVASPGSPGRLRRSYSRLGTILAAWSCVLFLNGRVCVVGIGLALAEDVLQCLSCLPLPSAGIRGVRHCAGWLLGQPDGG